MLVIVFLYILLISSGHSHRSIHNPSVAQSSSNSKIQSNHEIITPFERNRCCGTKKSSITKEYVTFSPKYLKFQQVQTLVPSILEFTLKNDCECESFEVQNITINNPNIRALNFQPTEVSHSLSTSITPFKVKLMYLPYHMEKFTTNLNLITNIGVLHYKIKAEAIPNPYRLTPLSNLQLSQLTRNESSDGVINYTHRHALTMYNPYNVSLNILEIFTSDSSNHHDSFLTLNPVPSSSAESTSQSSIPSSTTTQDQEHDLLNTGHLNNNQNHNNQQQSQQVDISPSSSSSSSLSATPTWNIAPNEEKYLIMLSITIRASDAMAVVPDHSGYVHIVADKINLVIPVEVHSDQEKVKDDIGSKTENTKNKQQQSSSSVNATASHTESDTSTATASHTESDTTTATASHTESDTTTATSSSLDSTITTTILDQNINTTSTNSKSKSKGNNDKGRDDQKANKDKNKKEFNSNNIVDDSNDNKGQETSIQQPTINDTFTHTNTTTNFTAMNLPTIEFGILTQPGEKKNLTVSIAHPSYEEWHVLSVDTVPKDELVKPHVLDKKRPCYSSVSPHPVPLLKRTQIPSFTTTTGNEIDSTGSSTSGSGSSSTSSNTMIANKTTTLSVIEYTAHSSFSSVNNGVLVFEVEVLTCNGSKTSSSLTRSVKVIVPYNSTTLLGGLGFPQNQSLFFLSITNRSIYNIPINTPHKNPMSHLLYESSQRIMNESNRYYKLHKKGLPCSLYTTSQLLELSEEQMLSKNTRNIKSKNNKDDDDDDEDYDEDYDTIESKSSLAALEADDHSASLHNITLTNFFNTKLGIRSANVVSCGSSNKLYLEVYSYQENAVNSLEQWSPLIMIFYRALAQKAVVENVLSLPLTCFLEVVTNISTHKVPLHIIDGSIRLSNINAVS